MMKKLTRLLALALALLMCCGMALAEPAPADVLVTVNGTPVTREDYEGYLATLTSYYTNQGYDTADETLTALLKQWALQTAMEYVLMDQQLVAQGLTLTEDEKAAAAAAAQAEWEAVIAEGMTYYGITDESTEEQRATQLVAILAELESMGYTEESYIEETLMYAGYDKLRAKVTEGITVSEADVLAYYTALVEEDKVAYEGNAAEYEQVQQMNQLAMMYGMTQYYTDVFYKPSGYRAVNHILLIPDEALLTAYSDLLATYEEQQGALEEGGEVTETPVTAEEVEAARLAILAAVQPTIDEINQKLAEGAAFNDLIPVYGQDPGMADAAAIAAGYEVHMDSIMWDPVFTQAAMSIEAVGGVSAPVVGSYGVHIVHYDHDVAGGAVELTADMKAAFEAALLADQQDNAYAVALNEWLAAATVEYSEEAKAIVGEVE